MTSPAQPGIGDAYKLHHVMGHDPICADCGAKSWDGEAEAIIEEAVNREVDKLP